jgi:hypothetical protein
MWPRSSPPASLPEQSFQVLAGRDQQRLGVHLPQPPKPEAAQAMPFLGFAKEGLDPGPSLVHRLPIGGRLVVGPHVAEVISVQEPMDLATPVPLGAGGLHRARVMGRRLSPIGHGALGVLGGPAEHMISEGHPPCAPSAPHQGRSYWPRSLSGAGILSAHIF